MIFTEIDRMSLCFRNEGNNKSQGKACCYYYE